MPRPIIQSFLIVCLAAATSFSQAYYPLHVGDRWSYSYIPYGPRFSVRTETDSVMPNGKRYSVVLDSSSPTIRFERQEGDTVYVYYPWLNKDVLFFDFSRGIGDTVSTTQLGADTMDIVLADSYVADIFGASRRQWVFSVNPIRQAIDDEYSVWICDSIGILKESFSFGEFFELQGAVIDGRIYGVIDHATVMQSLQPTDIELYQNYPNPFNPSTIIRYALPRRSHVSLAVFNTLGHQVAQLVNGEEEAGFHEVKFDGSGLASGVYFYTMQAGRFVETCKLVLLK